MTVELLEPSEWTIAEARRTVGQLRPLAAPGDEAAGIELFESLTSYLDDLYGDEFDEFLHPEDLSMVATEIDRIRTSAPTGSPIPVPPEQPDDTDDDDVIIRLDQPVNSSVDLAEGRELAQRLAGADDWQGNLGRALIGLYAYVDELYGGAGRFVELLSRSERDRVAAAVTGSAEDVTKIE